MGHETLTQLFMNNLGLLIALGVSVTAVGMVVAVVLTVFELRKSKAGTEPAEDDPLPKLLRTVEDLGQAVEGVKEQNESIQDLARQVKEIRKETKTLQKEIDLLREEVEHLSNLYRMDKSGSYAVVQPKEDKRESNEEANEKDSITGQPRETKREANIGLQVEVQVNTGKEESKKDSTGQKKSFWRKAEYFIPVWGQIKLVKNRRQQTGTGVRQ